MQARGYQLELLERALLSNVIAFLDTGSGKTFISVMLARELVASIHQSDHRCKIYFIADRVPLAIQQADVFEINSLLRVGCYYGEKGVDFWDCSRWEQEVDSVDVFVMTAQVLLDAMRHGFLKMEHCALLIVDECHHATKNHPFNQIFSEFYHTSQTKPRILGLTASPVNTNKISTSLSRKLAQLQTNLDCVIFSPSKIVQNEVSEFVAKPVERLIYYKSVSFNLDSFEFQSDKVYNIIQGWAQHLLVQCGKSCLLLGLEQLKKEIHSYSVMDYSFTCRIIESIVNQSFPEEVCIPCQGFEVSHKVLKLIEFLEICKLRSSFSCIIFVERRVLAFALSRFLSHVPSLSDFIKCDFIVSNDTYSSRFVPSGRIGVDKMITVLSRFRDGALNCIVSTSLTEEGLDVRSCNLIIRFDGVQSLTSYVQSRGRARNSDSLYIVMLEQDKFSNSKLSAIKKSENMVKSLCESNSSDPNFINKTAEPEDADVAYSDEIFIVNDTGAKITLNSALSVIHNLIAKMVAYDAYKAKKKRDKKKGRDSIDEDISMDDFADRVHAKFPNALLIQDLHLENEGEKSDTIPQASDSLTSLSDPHLLAKSYLDSPIENSLFKLGFDFSDFKYQCKLTILYAKSPIKESVGTRRITKKKAAQSAALVLCQQLYELCYLDSYLQPVDIKNMKETQIAPVYSKDKIHELKWVNMMPITLLQGPLVFSDIDNSIMLFPCLITVDKSMNLCPFYNEELIRKQSSFFLLLPSITTLNTSIQLFTGSNSTPVEILYLKEMRIDIESFRLILMYHRLLMELLDDRPRGPKKEVREKLSEDELAHLPPTDLDSFLFSSIINDISISVSDQEIQNIIHSHHEELLFLAPVDTSNRSIDYSFIVELFNRLDNFKILMKQQSETSRCTMTRFEPFSYKNDLNTTNNFSPFKEYTDSSNSLVPIEDIIRDRVLVTPHNGMMYVPARHPRRGHTIMSPFKEKPGYSSYHDYFLKHWNISLSEFQPLLDAYPIYGGYKQSYIHAISDQIRRATVKLPPQLAVLHPVPAHIFHLLKFIPSVVYSMQTQLRMQQARNMIGLELDYSLFQQALTSRAVHEMFNYERLEYLGDSLLKLVTSVHVFSVGSFDTEGLLSRERSNLLSNLTLYEKAKHVNIHRYMHFTAFQNRKWNRPLVKEFPSISPAPGFITDVNGAMFSSSPSVIEPSMNRQYISPKMVADSIEALIAAYYVSGGINFALKFLEFLRFKLIVDTSSILKIAREKVTYDDRYAKDFKNFQSRILCYEFKKPYLLAQALTHNSFRTPIRKALNREDGEIISSSDTLFESFPDYQRLEFLGDAVLDFVISEYLYKVYPNDSPGYLTERRKSLVCNSNFAGVAFRNEFHRILLHRSPAFIDAFELYSRRFKLSQQPDFRLEDEPRYDQFYYPDECSEENSAESKGFEQVEQDPHDILPAPKILGDIFESVAAAVYLDSEMNLEIVASVFYRLLRLDSSKKRSQFKTTEKWQ